MANAVVTVSARNKMMKARAGEIKLPKIIGCVFGDGAVDEDGNVLNPNETDSTLRNEIFKKQIDGYEIISPTSCLYRCTLENNELSGKIINEIGLYDEDGDVVAIKTFFSKGKDDDLKMTFEIEDIF